MKLIALAGFTLMALAVTGCTIYRLEPPIGPTIPDAKPVTLSPQEFTVVTAHHGDSLSSLAAKYLHNASLGWMIAELNGIDAVEPGQTLVIPLTPLERGGLTPRGYQTVPILTYHKFSETNADVVTVTRRAFEDQMRFLKNHGYQVISLDEFFDFIELKGPIPRNWFRALLWG